MYSPPSVQPQDGDGYVCTKWTIVSTRPPMGSLNLHSTKGWFLSRECFFLNMVKRCCVRNCTNHRQGKKPRCGTHTRMLTMRKHIRRLEGQVRALQQDQLEFKNNWECELCCERFKTVAFQCGHRTCRICSNKLDTCPFCREEIILWINLY